MEGEKTSNRDAADTVQRKGFRESLHRILQDASNSGIAPSSGNLASPSSSPTLKLTELPSSTPSGFPSEHPSVTPSGVPTRVSPSQPSASPSTLPKGAPSSYPSYDPIFALSPTIGHLARHCSLSHHHWHFSRYGFER